MHCTDIAYRARVSGGTLAGPRVCLRRTTAPTARYPRQRHVKPQGFSPCLLTEFPQEHELVRTSDPQTTETQDIKSVVITTHGTKVLTNTYMYNEIWLNGHLIIVTFPVTSENRRSHHQTSSVLQVKSYEGFELYSFVHRKYCTYKLPHISR